MRTVNQILVLFTCFNRLEKTKRCVERLRNEQDMICDFLVVDDCSKDGTAEYLNSLAFVQCIHGNGSLFYSKGMRMAMEKAKKAPLDKSYDYILLVNDDVSFSPGVLKKLIAYLNGEQAIMVGATCDAAGNLTYGGIQKKSNWRPKFEKVMSCESRIACDTMNANCVLIPIRIFQALDIIDAKYWHALGDFDYGFQASNRGYPIYVSNFFVGVCENDHSPKGSWLDPNLPLKERWKLKESPLGNPSGIWFYFLKKHYGWFTAALYTLNDWRKLFLLRRM